MRSAPSHVVTRDWIVFVVVQKTEPPHRSLKPGQSEQLK